MNKILIIFIFLCVAGKSFAQFPNDIPQGSPQQSWWQKGSVGSLTGFHFRYNYPDTTAANNAPYIKNIPNFLIVANDTLRKRNNAATKWETVGVSSTGMAYWGLGGNLGTIPGTNFIGTLDAKDFVLKTNNTTRILLGAAGILDYASSPTVKGLGYDTVSKQLVAVPVGGGGSNNWLLTGNSGTNPESNYLGTSDVKDLVFKTNGIDRLRIKANGTLLTDDSLIIGVTGIPVIKLYENGNDVFTKLQTEGAETHLELWQNTGGAPVLSSGIRFNLFGENEYSINGTAPIYVNHSFYINNDKRFELNIDSSSLMPPNGRFNIDSLRRATSMSRMGVMVRDSVGGDIKYIKASDVFSSVNIYNSDGTLTGTRTLNGAANALLFNNLTGFSVFDAVEPRFIFTPTASTIQKNNTYVQAIDGGIAGGALAAMGSGPNYIKLYNDSLLINGITAGVGIRALRYNPTTKKVTYADTTISSGGTPAGNFGNVQLNRNGVFATPSNDSLNFVSGTGLSIKGGVVLSGQASPTYAVGKLVYDTDNESLTFFNNDANVAMNLGQEEWIRVTNNTGSSIPNGSAVYINGASAGMPTIALAQSNAAATTIGAGLTTETIANGAVGYVTSIGVVRGLNTSAFTAGQTVYIDPTTPGALTATAPSAPNYRYRVGIVAVSNATTGSIHVTPSTAALGNGTANQVFGMNSAGTAQEVKSITATAPITVTNAANSIVISNAAGFGTELFTTGGVANTYTLTPTTALASYTSGVTYRVQFNLANTGASTINISGLGAKTLVKAGATATANGDIVTTKIYYIVYDGTNFQILNYGGASTGSGSVVQATAPVFATNVVGSASMDVFNTTSTTVNSFGAATTLNVGGTPTTAVTHNYSANATANATTKTINIGTGGVSGSITAITLGSSTAGATTRVGIGISPTSSLLEIAAGSTSVAPLKFTAGAPTTTLAAGQMQYNTGLWIIDSSAARRDTIATRQWARQNIGGVTTLSAIGSSPNANGATISGSTLNLQPANGTFGGALTATDWTTFNNKIGGSIASTQIAVGSGSGTISGSSSLTWNGAQVDIIAGNVNPGFRIYNTGYGWYFYNGAGGIGNFGMFDISAGLDRFIINTLGKLQIGAYGAGTLVTDAAGNVTAASDERLKKNITYSKVGLKEVLNLRPINYNWNKKSGNEMDSTYTGFSAQNVKANIPNGTGLDKDGYLTLQDRAILAALTNSVIELKKIIDKQQKEINRLKRKK